MRRLQNRLLAIMVMGIVVASMINGLIFTFATKNAISEDNKQILTLKVRHASTQLQTKVTRCENIGNTMALYVKESMQAISDHKYKANYNNEIAIWNKLAWGMVKNVHDVTAVGFQFDPAYVNNKTGFLISYNNMTSKMENYKDLKIASTKPDANGRLSPYAQAVAAKKAVWTEPYYNIVNGIYSVTYAKPVYLNNKLIGVVYCDLDFDTINSNTNSITLYDHGHAILTDRYGQQLNYGGSQVNFPNSFMKKAWSHDVYNSMVALNGEKTYVSSRKITKNMYMIIAVPQSDVYTPRNRTIFTVLFSIVLLGAFLCLITVAMVNNIFKMATKDSLTEASNKLSYQEYLKELQKKIPYTYEHYAVAVFDINHLKAVNDEKGHMAGDQLIIDGCQMIHTCFPENEIFRIGGDEFTIVFDHQQKAITRNRITRFKRMMEKRAQNFASNEEVVVSCGYAEFMPGDDYQRVFKRADHNMYEEKAKFYAYNPQIDRRH